MKMTAGSKISEENNPKYEELLEKVFEPRQSLLSELFGKNKYLKSLYNLCFALAVFVIISTAIENYKRENRFYLGSKIIVNAFQNFNLAVLGWMCLFVSTNLIYWGFTLWAQTRNRLKTTLWDVLWLMVYTIYYPLMILYSSKFAVTYDLGVASSLALLLETTRFLMKTHAFVRSNCSKYFKEDIKEILHPSYSHYMYFSFSPTIVYRDSYPRTNDPIQWRNVFKWFTEFFIGILLFSILFDHAYRTPLKDLGLTYFSLMDIFLILMQNIHIGIVLGLIFFYCGLHCYFNAMAEILKFSDRMFYKDWWLSTTIDEIFRNWSIFVHDWLYLYIYKDVYIYVFPTNRALSKIVVFLLSAIFHDYIIINSVRVYIPVCTISFTIFVIFMKSRSVISDIQNFHFWLALGLLISGKLTFLTAEYFARVNCPLETVSFLDNFKLRFLNCKVH